MVETRRIEQDAKSNLKQARQQREQERQRRNRSLAIGATLFALVIIFYAVTIVKFGAGMSGAS
jgi:hypothetical protein